MRLVHSAIFTLPMLFSVLLFSTILYGENSEAKRINPVVDGEVEVLPTQNSVATILPAELLEREKYALPLQIRRSYAPGVTLESKHFLVEADGYWAQNADQLAQLVKQFETICYEAELTVSLWRQPIFTSRQSKELTYNRKLSRVRETENILVPEFSGNPIHLCVVRPGAQLAKVTDPTERKESVWGNDFCAISNLPCRFSVVGQNAYLTLEIKNVAELKNENLIKNVRAEIFRSVLHDGNEENTFPAWLQTGLSAVFAGVEAENMRTLRTVDAVSQLPISKEDATLKNDRASASAVLWVRYFLTANDGNHYFPFWNELNQLVRAKGATHNIGTLHRAHRTLARFAQNLKNRPENESLEFWRFLSERSSGETDSETMHTPSAPCGSQNYVRVFWNPNVLGLNLQPEAVELEDGTQQIRQPIISLSEYKRKILQPTFEQMASILRIVYQYQAENGSATSTTTTENGIKITEFRKAHVFRTLSQETNSVTENGESEENATPETTTEVTAEDIQALEAVYDWFTARETPRITQSQDGTVLSAHLTPQKVEALFHPENCDYLLQEYEGNTVLSATFEDGSVLHVVLEMPKLVTDIPTIRILGYELPQGASDM